MLGNQNDRDFGEAKELSRGLNVAGMPVIIANAEELKAAKKKPSGEG